MKTVVFVVLGLLALVEGTEKKRISRLKCQEYNEISKKNNICNDEKILDGIVQLKDYPFVGVVGFEERNSTNEIEWLCSVSLISDQFVLTTAHCTNKPSTKQVPKYVRLGATDISSTNSNAKLYIISTIIRHPEYSPRNYSNDIALLKLDKVVEFTEYIQPACLYTGQDLSEYNIAGFNFFTNKKTETRSGLILHQRNDVVEKRECSEVWNNHIEVNFDKQFCTRMGHISCDIKSGAPLLHKEEELSCMQSVAGIVDLGFRDLCNGKAALNVKISGFIDWIESTVWPTQ